VFVIIITDIDQLD